jgi:uncharacterized YccA/Bax inhibitor family protein
MSNPILNNNRFSPQENDYSQDKVYEAELVDDGRINQGIIYDEPMTINGTVNKIFMLSVCLLAGAAISVYNMLSGNPGLAQTLMIAGAIIGFILVLVTCFNIRLAKYTAAPYSLLEGFVLGGFSTVFEARYQGIVLQAISLTFAALFVMLMLYKAKMITYTDKLASVIKTGLLSICAIYLIQIVASFFGRGIPQIFDAGPIGIIFSLVVVGFASVSLIQDFFFIETAAMKRLSKDYEWFGAMGLMITMVWLYMEILRLLAKLNSRR